MMVKGSGMSIPSRIGLRTGLISFITELAAADMAARYFPTVFQPGNSIEGVALWDKASSGNEVIG